MLECAICLEDYQEGDLELHREMCIVRLMFRCSLCNEDYVSKEGLWNHLDLHEIVDESKELHYQEIKAKHKLHQCVLCNDQRAYLESPYWKHVHDVHDGFFLRCSDCGENFRSEKLKNDHALNHCESRDKTVVSGFTTLGEEQVPIEVESKTSDADDLKLSLGEQRSNPDEGLANLSNASDAENNIVDKESTQRKYLRSRFLCHICGTTFSSRFLLLRHKRAEYSCMEGGLQNCPHCQRKFQITEFQTHLSLCEKNKFACELCTMKFETPAFLTSHMRKVHRKKKILKNDKYDKSQEKNAKEKHKDLTRKTTKRSSADAFVSSSDSSSSMNVVDTDSSKAKKDIADNGVNPLVENQSKTTSSITCVHCGKECPNASSLRQHVLHCHEPTMCSICRITFEGYYQFYYHKRQVHSKTQKLTKPRYECAKCSKKFICIALYKHHLKECDPEQNLVILKDKSNPKAVVKRKYKINRYKDMKYHCPTCGRKFHERKKYDSHCYLCEQRRYSCKLCGRMFKEFCSVKRHNERFHPDESNLKNIRIHRDKKQDPNDDLKLEMSYNKLSVAKKRNLHCPHCSRKFRLKCTLEDHVANCENLKHACELCGQRFELRNKLDYHKKRIHQGSRPLRSADFEGSDSDEEQNQSRAERTDAAQETTICNMCNISFGSTDELVKHKIQSHSETQPRYECALCSKEFHCIKRYKSHSHACDPVQRDLSSRSGKLIYEEGSNLKAAAEILLNEPSCTKCVHCGVEVSNDVTLRHHILIHHDPVACDICGINLSSFSQAQHHVKTKHKDSKLKCPHCSMRFALRVRLERHVSKCANETIPCDFCGARFENVTAVTEHKRMICRVYNRRDNIPPPLDSGLSQLKCYYCNSNEEFPSQEYLKLHLKAGHELTKCNICGITIIGLSSIKNHKIICHTEPKHECRTCGRKFHFKTKYDKHCFICELKMYFCKLCGSTYKQASSIKRHNARYHPDESSLDNFQIQIQDKTQVHPNIDLEMDITTEETTISARDDQGLSTVNPSFKAVADRKAVSKKTSKPRVENQSNKSYSCDICGITMHTYSQFSYHRATRHKEGKFQCPHCSRKFHFKIRLEKHVSSCASFEYSCESCGQKFCRPSNLEIHKKQLHRCGKPLTNMKIEAEEYIEEQTQHSVQKTDAAQKMARCVICTITFASTDELMKHKLNCPKPDDSQFGAEKISLFHGAKKAKPDSTIVPQVKNIELKMEIEVEETMLQEQEYEVRNENPLTSSATTLHPHSSKSKNVEVEVSTDLDNRIKVKEECLEDEEQTIAEQQTNNQKTSAVLFRPVHQINFGYVPIKTCSFEDAKSFVKNFEFGFSFVEEKTRKKGNMRFYRCTRFKKRVRPQCDRRVFIFTPNINEKSTVCAKGEHSCINASLESLSCAKTNCE